tara:strand:- start:294 stop:2822 length:2529 start_codon:yes stop_codon:yes gene_type:complete
MIMNKLYITILFCFFNIFSFSQIWEDELLKSNQNPTIQEKSIAFEQYRNKHPYTKGNGFKPYAREMDFILERSSLGGSFKADALFKEWEKLKENNSYSKISNKSNWVSKGPINTPIILSNGKKRGNGRVNCIAFDPVDSLVIWIGSPAGGLWKSVDGGSNWTTNTDGLPVIGVSHIAIDPEDSQIMYIVTGDAYATDTYSIGILKSNDGGGTWNTTGLSYNIDQEKTVNKVIINPNYTDSLYAVTNSNILISADAGLNWLTVGAIGRWRDIEFKPSNSNVIYAAKQSSGGSNIYRSTDGGGNWIVINNGIIGNRYRPLIGVTPDNPEVIYALFSGSDYSFHGLYKSSDSGDNWIIQSSTPNILGRETDGSGVGGQSWYDLSLGVATNNENLVYVGGINIWRSDNGGVNWDIDANSGNNQQLYSYMHVDQHAFEFNPHTHVAYAGNDGGFYKYMENLNKWVDISDGLEISQFYNLGLSQSNPNRLVAGAQDNGTEMLTNSTWDAIMGGDGMECKIDHYDDNIIYAEYQYGGLRKSYNGGNSWNNIKPVTYEGGWNTPYEMHSSNSNIIVIGYDEVYRSTTGGAIWDSISYNVSGGQAIRSIALAPSDENYIYAASYSKIKVTKDAGLSWTNIKPGLVNYNITDVAVSNSNSDRAWVTFSEFNSSHKVYETNDAGSSWVNISGSNLPGLPVNCIVHQGGANDDLYIGTDIGVYYKNNTMSEWIPFNEGLPNVIVKELEIHYDEGTISAATFGRGVWKSPLNSLSTNVSNNEKINFKIYPNPAKNKITITTSQQNINVTIFTITGRKIIETTAKTINTSNFAKGCYIIEIKNEKGFSKREKLIIK